MIRDAYRAQQLAKALGADLRDVGRAVEILAKVVEELLTILKEQERRLRDADTVPPPT
jgi:hypothetical protein